MKRAFLTLAVAGLTACAAPLMTTAQVPPAKSLRSLARLRPGVRPDVANAQFAAIAPDGQRLVAQANGQVRVFDLSTGRCLLSKDLRQLNNGQFMLDDVADITPDGRHVLVGLTSGSLRAHDLQTGELAYTIDHGRFIIQAKFSPDGKRLSIGSSRYANLRIMSGARLERSDEYAGHGDMPEPEIFAAGFSHDGKRVAYAGRPQSSDVGKRNDLFVVSFYDSNRQLFELPSSDGPQDIAWSPDDRLIAVATEYEVFVLDAATGAQLKRFGSNDSSVAFTPGGLLVMSADGGLDVVDPAKGYARVTSHPGRAGALRMSSDGRFLLSTSGADVQLRDPKHGGLIASVIATGENECVFYTPEGYYMASPTASQSVSFGRGMTAYTFDTFDAVFNRPDLVMARLGVATPELIAAYRNAYRKRLAKLGFTEEQLSRDAALPSVALTGSVPTSTSEDAVSLQVEANDSAATLDRVNVYVNDVPIFGARGRNLKSAPSRSWKGTLEIALSSGANKIQVSVHNDKGLESPRETVQITKTSERAARLWVGAIGVSDYLDDQYDLTYAAKDAKDIAAHFEANKGRFAGVERLTLTDKEVTREGLDKLRAFFARSAVDDQIVLFVAGHGVLDDRLDYYFAPADMDFASPASRGIAYDALEGLLDGVNARKKLLLVDTCHSGEVDKDAVQLGGLAQGVVEARSFRGLRQVRKRTADGHDVNALVRELFSDLRRGSGAIIISSAAGSEFALESDEWKNGVFTYSILQGLRGRAADADKDGNVRISELQGFVHGEVRRLTQGRQTPTVRQENIEYDFEVP